MNRPAQVKGSPATLEVAGSNSEYTDVGILPPLSWSQCQQALEPNERTSYDSISWLWQQVGQVTDVNNPSHLTELRALVMVAWSYFGALDHPQVLALSRYFTSIYAERRLFATSEPALEIGFMMARLRLCESAVHEARDQLRAVRRAAKICCRNRDVYLEATFQLGWSHFRLEDWTEAERFYRKCLQSACACSDSNPNSGRYWLYSVSGLANNRRVNSQIPADSQNAMVFYDSILKTPNWNEILDDDWQSQLIYAQAAGVQKELGKYHKAVELLQAGVDRMTIKCGADAPLTLRSKLNLVGVLLDDVANVEAARVLLTQIDTADRSKLDGGTIQLIELEKVRLEARDMHRAPNPVFLSTGLNSLEERIGQLTLITKNEAMLGAEKEMCQMYGVCGAWDAAERYAQMVLQKLIVSMGGRMHGGKILLSRQNFLLKAGQKLRSSSTGSVPSPPPIPSPSEPEFPYDLKRFICNVEPCRSRQLALRNTLVRHLLTTHNINEYGHPETGRVFPCHICGKEFKRPDHLGSHMKKHE